MGLLEFSPRRLLMMVLSGACGVVAASAYAAFAFPRLNALKTVLPPRDFELVEGAYLFECVAIFCTGAFLASDALTHLLMPGAWTVPMKREQQLMTATIRVMAGATIAIAEMVTLRALGSARLSCWIFLLLAVVMLLSGLWHFVRRREASGN